MASIIKRGKTYSVVYSYKEEGKRKQKWETFPNEKEAKKRKAEIEYKQSEDIFIAPSGETVRELIKDYISLYGEKKWTVNTYDSNMSLIDNYILPFLGDMKLQDITPRAADIYVTKLLKSRSMKKCAEPCNVSVRTAEKTVKLLKSAFRQAVRYGLVAKNPFEQALLPKAEYHKRDIWTKEDIEKALDACTDDKLYIAMNLAFACSMRIGEILGLTWKDVHISEEDIMSDNAYVYIRQELTRASENAIKHLDERNVYFIFSPIMSCPSTRLILKKPKTDSSIRKVWLPKTLAYILREWKGKQERLKEILGEEYYGYDLVCCLPNGRPCDQRSIAKSFEKLKKKAELPNVVFHSLRHSSTTYKLKLNHGDLKATQGDTGHAEIDMITKIYAHILDEDRKTNAQRFEDAFYGGKQLKDVRPPERKDGEDVENLIKKIRDNPEIADMLIKLLNKG